MTIRERVESWGASDRNPAIAPRPGDELRGDLWRYRVLSHKRRTVTYQMILRTDGTSYGNMSVSLAGWRALAAGLTVEKVA